MSSKYGPTDSRYVQADVALTDHALHRYRQRTPHDCEIAPQIAWRRGEFVKHEQICRSDDDENPLINARIYRHSEDWGIVFLVDRNIGSLGASKVVVTANSIRGFNHKPTRNYLEAYPVHGEVNTDE
ncbi:hypothetical protein OSG_eHP14_00065 [environmental Halophage eHP-14]|nr:hypothetical protein OSG_eHP14_00065 [environmental Halophage eHP-14]